MNRIALNPESVPDLGKYGYKYTMTVYDRMNRSELKEKLSNSDCSLAQAQAATVADFLIRFSSDPNGTGVCQDFPMHAADAEMFEIGKKTTFHYYRQQIPGYGTLVAITTDPSIKQIDEGK